LAAFEDFKKSGCGDRTLLFDGRRVKHYALTDHKEFFAEMTESYFGLNDFFLFNRPLKRVDYVGSEAFADAAENRRTT
jgi:hypothetical protein